MKLATLVCSCLLLVGCSEQEEAPLLPIPLDLHQPEAAVLKQLDSAGYKVREHFPNAQSGDSIPVAGLPGITTYFFYPDGLWHGVHFAHTDTTFQSFVTLRKRLGEMYGNEDELNQQPQNKQGYAVWKPFKDEVRVVRLSAGRGRLQMFIGDSSALAGEAQ